MGATGPARLVLATDLVVGINRNWQPYCDSGHWRLITDAGWFWQSDYSWGWA